MKDDELVMSEMQKNGGSPTSFWRYYHLRSTVKRERLFAHVYFSNETVSRQLCRLDHSLQCRRYFGAERLMNHVFDAAILDCNWMLDR